jgi:ornithine decarboxylase
MSTARINEAINLWNTQLPSVKPYYAVKCNPARPLLQHLYDAGLGFDCASERELKEVRALGEAKVIYANPCKSARDIQVARSLGEPLTVVDSVEEVEKLGDYGGGALIRIAVDDSGSAMPFSSKFGTRDVSRISQAALATGLRIRGISFHVGSGCADADGHAKAIRLAYKYITQLSSFHNYLNIIDIGGGYLANKRQFWATARSIRTAIRDVEDDGSHIKWISEPGRFLAANSFDFYVQVIGKKSAAGGWKYTIDDSLYGQFTCILFDHAKPCWVRVSDGAERRRGPGIIFGRTCDSVDVIAKAADMEELEVGDWLWFPSMGAYTRATASEFNGFPAPPIFIEGDAPSWPQGAEPRGVSRMPAVVVPKNLMMKEGFLPVWG